MDKIIPCGRGKFTVTSVHYVPGSQGHYGYPYNLKKQKTVYGSRSDAGRELKLLSVKTKTEADKIASTLGNRKPVGFMPSKMKTEKRTTQKIAQYDSVEQEDKVIAYMVELIESHLTDERVVYGGTEPDHLKTISRLLTLLPDNKVDLTRSLVAEIQRESYRAKRQFQAKHSDSSDPRNQLALVHIEQGTLAQCLDRSPWAFNVVNMDPNGGLTRPYLKTLESIFSDERRLADKSLVFLRLSCGGRSGARLDTTYGKQRIPASCDKRGIHAFLAKFLVNIEKKGIYKIAMRDMVIYTGSKNNTPNGQTMIFIPLFVTYKY